jgi:hypothetical protein
MEPLGIYNELKSVPSEFLKEIGAGRLKGMSDIKPQWRIMKLTELFGACGFGWKVQNLQFEYKQVSNNEIVVNCRLEFLYKWNDVWSEPIPATGGSKLATNESKGLYVSDEAEKMAYTDALSVAGKMIGLASDIYMGYGGKYDGGNTNIPSTNQNSSQGQNQAPQEVKKKWFNLKTKDGTVIDKNYKYIIDNYNKGFNSDQIIKALEKAGYTIHSTVIAEIGQMKLVDNYKEGTDVK